MVLNLMNLGRVCVSPRCKEQLASAFGEASNRVVEGILSDFAAGIFGAGLTPEQHRALQAAQLQGEDVEVVIPLYVDARLLRLRLFTPANRSQTLVDLLD